MHTVLVKSAHLLYTHMAEQKGYGFLASSFVFSASSAFSSSQCILLHIFHEKKKKSRSNHMFFYFQFHFPFSPIINSSIIENTPIFRKYRYSKINARTNKKETRIDENDFKLFPKLLFLREMYIIIRACVLCLQKISIANE